MEIDIDADRQPTSQKRRREATRLDSFIENDMTNSGSDDEVSQDEFSKWLRGRLVRRYILFGICGTLAQIAVWSATGII